jgi:DNA-binding HxlR family transcriptional regulator
LSQSHTCVPDEDTCSVGAVLDQLSGKWNIGIILAAANGPIRFTELEREVHGISRRMLTLALRKLERDGLLVRTVYPTVPPKVEYILTGMARELHESFAVLTAWADRHKTSIAAARIAYDEQNS